MSQTAGDTPRPFRPAVAQRHLETEVAHCVGGVISPLLANVALSVLDDYFMQQWTTTMGSEVQRQTRKRRGQANYRLVRYADDCAPRARLEVAM